MKFLVRMISYERPGVVKKTAFLKNFIKFPRKLPWECSCKMPAFLAATLMEGIPSRVFPRNFRTIMSCCFCVNKFHELAKTCSKLAIETLKKGVKYVQS